MVDKKTLKGIATYLSTVEGWEVKEWDGELRCCYNPTGLTVDVHIEPTPKGATLELTIITLNTPSHRKEKVWQWNSTQNPPDFTEILTIEENTLVHNLLDELHPALQSIEGKE